MGKAACVAALPFFCVAMALAMGAVQFEELTKMASCVAECDCARSYAIGGAMVWAIAIQAAMRTGKEPLPKTEKASLPVPQIPAGKVAAKAA